MTDKQTGALEKLTRGIQETRQDSQRRALRLAQDYFDESAEMLKQRVKENRAALESVPDQVPGGREEAFQTLFQELMNNYSVMEQGIDEARENAANLDTDQITRQGGVDVTDAARHQVEEMGVDLTEVEGTGSEGRVIADGVEKLAQTMEDGASEEAGQQAQDTGQLADQNDGAAEEIDASDAAKREAKARGIDLSKIEGTGTDGRIVYWDVVNLPSSAEDSADPAGQAAQGTGDAASQAGDAAEQTGGAASQLARQALGATQDTAEQAGQTAQQGAGSLADQAEQNSAAREDSDAVEQTGGAASQLARQALGATQDTAEQAGQTAQQGAGSLADQAEQNSAAREDSEEPRVTKAAKRKAEQMNVDLSQIKGSGTGGLITIKDVMGP